MIVLTTQEMLSAVFILLLLLIIFGTIFRRALKFVFSIGLIMIAFFVSTCYIPGKLTQMLNGEIDTTQIVQEISDTYEQTGLPNPVTDIKERTGDKIDWTMEGWSNSYNSLYHKIVGNPSIIIEDNR